RIKPTLYHGSVIAKEHDVIFVIDDEETWFLEEESPSKMLGKQNDPISLKHKINISPIDYSKLNKIKEYFGKHFVTKKELSVEQAFWLKQSNYNPDTSLKSHTPVRIEAPSKLPKVSFVNESLKKLRYHLASFDKVVKKRTTSDAISVDEITEVQNVFNQMEAAVDQCSVDKNAFEIQIKQLSIDNDQLLKQIISQEIVHIGVNSVDILNLNKSCLDECNKCLEHETELLKQKDLIEKALKNELRKLKGKNVIDTAVTKPIATIAPEMFKLDIEPISHRLNKNKDAYEKDYYCSACALGKRKKHSHKPKAEDFIQEKIYLLHMDLYGPMRIQSINERKYILVIVDDYSRFTWVKFVRSKDEVLEFVIKFLKMIQVHLTATVRNIKTDNGKEFVNQTLIAYYEEVIISHEKSVARTPQHNGVVPSELDLLP
nr:retrovirus-related Pol polyprotein from transposon TNT 1-94 [Tanacetum cinerariifolium]